MVVLAWFLMVARRNWARNPNAMEVAMQYNQENANGDQITVPYQVKESLIEKALQKK